jgi:hypothetical protein
MCINLTPRFVEAWDNFQIARYKIKTGLTEPVLVRQSSIKHVVSLGMTETAETQGWLHFKNPNGLVLSCRRYVDQFPSDDLTKYLDVTWNYFAPQSIMRLRPAGGDAGEPSRAGRSRADPEMAPRGRSHRRRAGRANRCRRGASGNENAGIVPPQGTGAEVSREATALGQPKRGLRRRRFAPVAFSTGRTPTTSTSASCGGPSSAASSNPASSSGPS